MAEATTTAPITFTAPTFDPAAPNGGDVFSTNVNTPFTGLEFNYAYIIFCGYIVFLILPGLGLFYAGLSSRKSGLSMLFLSLAVTAVVSFQWIFWGFSLAFSRSASPFIGDLAHFGMKNVRAAPSVGSALLPDIVFCFYQLMFCACTVMIVIGGAFERGKIIPSLIFGFIWATVVYCPIACWTWNPAGWLFNLPSYDFAGGGPVHQASGWAALAYALVLGKRREPGAALKKARPHNTSLVFLGTILIWAGWFGFNGGSALNASIRAMQAAFNTNIAAAFGIIGWVAVDMVRHKGRFSVVGACEGCIAGLVGITPAAGFVSVWFAALIGFVTAVVCALSENVGALVKIDDGLEVFKLHGIGGIVGSFLTGIFADEAISLLDGASSYPGAINGNGIQVAYQLAEIGAIAGYSFGVSCLVLFALKYIPGLGLRVSEDAEIRGLDLDQFFDEQIGEWEFFGPKGFPGADEAVLQGRSPVGTGRGSSGDEMPEKN
ncbi:Ammonium transporter 1 [Sphaceloma murrayae]|uniref:Ammonium transporter n=1 Tax=Sphaceloma murrayae TaxID=2082308 RepID=A0A2K1QTG9_9PEZI|nr:Ammonium transporter 1 [Sphaceloma murrayae]